MTTVSRDMFVRNPLSCLMDAVTGQGAIRIQTADGDAVVLSANRYRELEKAERNEAYIRKIDEGFAELRAGGGITKTMAELRAMEGDD